MMRRHLRTAGTSSLEHVLTLSLVGLLGLTGLTALGGAFGDAIAHDAAGDGVQGASIATAPPAVGASAMAGVASALREASSAAKGWVREVPARLAKAKKAYVETRRLITPTKTVPWDELKPEYAERAAKVAMKRTERRYAMIKSRFVPKTAAGTVRKLDGIDRELDHLATTLFHLDSVSDSDEISAAFNAVDEMTTAFGSKLDNDEAIWAAFKRIEASRGGKRLRGEEKRAFGQLMDARREGGADLSAAVRARLVEIDGELAELSRTFSQNSVKANKGFEIYFEDASALDGLLPEHLMKAEESAKKAGKTGYRLSLADGTAGQAMGRVHNEATREAIWRKMEPLHRTGETNNLPVAQRILELRREQAEILGFENFADLATTTRMVKNGASAEAFVDDLAAKLRDAAQQEYDEFRAFRKSVDGKDTFERWDGAYWSRKFSESRLDLDALREYFTIDNAIDAFRMTAEKLYGIRFEETKPAVWHPEVRSFEVLDHDGRLLGRFQLDLVSRDGKRSGAWHMSVNKGLGDEPTTSVIVGNLPQPTPDGKPSLIGLGGATTIFHELGHGLHGVFSEARLRSLNGTAVARDFVELPSQLMENFVWEKPVFDVLARHWKTGEPMPAELRDALYATRTEGAAGGQFGSLANAKLDIGLHRHYTGKTPEELEAFAEKLLSDFVLDGSTARPWRMVPQFGHIFSGGYASGYYGYSWAEVLDADAFTKFQADGTLSRSVGDSFRRELLSKGGTADPDVLFRNFMGRDPDPGAHVRRMGIEP